MQNIDKATSGGDMLTWGIMFAILIVVAIALAIWTKMQEDTES